MDEKSYVPLNSNVARYSYNEVGDVAEQITILDDSTQISTTYVYEYDKHNNWVSRKANNKSKTVRTINYF